MKRRTPIVIATALACMGMALSPVIAGEPSVISDVALRSGGVLVGQVVDQQGAAKAGAEVAIRFREQEVVRTATDANGVFAAQGLRGGQYEIVADHGTTVARLWTAGTAPPSAKSAALLVSGGDVVRGMPGSGVAASWGQWVTTHPYITAGVVAGTATAIAVPLAIDHDSGS